MAQPIDPRTLAAIGGQSQNEAARGFQQSMSTMAADFRARREEKSNAELRALQGTQAQLNIEKTNYELRQAELNDKIEEAQADKLSKYRKNFTPPPEGSSASAYVEAANEAGDAGETVMQKFYLDLVKESQKAGGGGELSAMSKMIEEQKKYAAKGEFESAARLGKNIAKMNSEKDPYTKVNKDHLASAQFIMEDAVGEPDAKGFDGIVVVKLNQFSDTLKQRELDVSLAGDLLNKVIKEANKGLDSTFVDKSGPWGWGDNELKRDEVIKFIDDEIAVLLGETPVKLKKIVNRSEQPDGSVIVEYEDGTLGVEPKP